MRSSCSESISRLGLLASPVTPAFIQRGALEAKLLTQDYNWIGFGRALPSGLVINSIVYGVFLATGGMILVAVPASWLPNGRAGVWRAGGILALLVAFGSFKLTAWLGILAGAVVFMLLRIPDPRTRWRALVIPPLVLVVLGFIFQDAIEQRLLDIARGSLFTRLLSWFTYARNIRHGGLIGVGLGRASLLAPSVSTVAGGQQATHRARAGELADRPCRRDRHTGDARAVPAPRVAHRAWRRAATDVGLAGHDDCAGGQPGGLRTS